MRVFLFSIIILICWSCNNSDSRGIPGTPAADSAQKKIAFFPVTAYLKGQLYDIAEKGILPVKYTTSNNHTDSVMLKFDQLNTEMAEFLQPVIDSLNLVPYYTEAKFLDQTVNAFTFSYDANSQKPDSLTLQHWDVYIEPETSKVKRIYMVKHLSTDKQMQLTWVSNQWCKIITIHNINGTSAIEKEVRISWGDIKPS